MKQHSDHRRSIAGSKGTPKNRAQHILSKGNRQDSALLRRISWRAGAVRPRRLLVVESITRKNGRRVGSDRWN